MYKVQVIAKKTQQNKNQKTKKKNKQTARLTLCMSVGKGGVGVVYWVSFIGICS